MNGSYHQGDLRRALLAEAAQLVACDGPSLLSMRELARRAGVSHAAPAHHFGDRRGLFTALAIEGLEALAVELESASVRGFDEAAVAYVRFAMTYPGHYAVMHRPDLWNGADPDLVAARRASWRVLESGVASIPVENRSRLNDAEAAHAAWALVHGLASQVAEGMLSVASVDGVTRAAARQLFG